MKQTPFFFAAAVAVVVVVGSVSAAYGANPLDELRAAIDNLQARITAIELTGTGTAGQMEIIPRSSAWVSMSAISGEAVDAIAYCELNETLVGGGYEVSGGGVDISQAQIDVTGQPVWIVAGFNHSKQPRELKAIAHCAKLI